MSVRSRLSSGSGQPVPQSLSSGCCCCCGGAPAGSAGLAVFGAAFEVGCKGAMTRFDCDAEAELADWAASAGFLDGVGRLLDSGGQLPGS